MIKKIVIWYLEREIKRLDNRIANLKAGCNLSDSEKIKYQYNKVLTTVNDDRNNICKSISYIKHNWRW